MTNKDHISSEDLMIQYQSDSPDNAYDAFKELYSRHSEKVFLFLRKKTGNNADSEDLLQKVFIKIHDSKHLYQNKFKFEQWIFVIARTQVLDHYRSTDRYNKRIAKTDLYEEQSKENDLNLKGIDEDQRELLEMKFIDELSYNEIARIVNRSEVSLRKTISRLISRIKKVNHYE